MERKLLLYVFKQTHCGKVEYVLEDNEGKLFWDDKLHIVALTIRNSPTLQKKQQDLAIVCTPPHAITIPFGKTPFITKRFPKKK